jgi:hypothetical protein
MLLYYILLFLLGMTFIYSVYLKVPLPGTSTSMRDSCEVDEDCRDPSKGGKPGAQCVYNASYSKNKCITSDQAICRIRGTDGLDWYKTDLDITNGDVALTLCEEDSDCDKCVNQPQWGCVKAKNTFSTEKELRLKVCNGDDECKDVTCSNGAKPGKDGTCLVAYPKFDADGNIINKNNEPIKYGYCMPKVSDQVGLDGTSACNSQTSDIFLTQVDEYSAQWSCLCKNPSMFSHTDTSTSNCVNEKICGADVGVGKLLMPTDPQQTCTNNAMCGENGSCCSTDKDAMGKVCLEDGDQLANGGDNYACHTRWDKTNETNWSEYGKCLCAPGYRYVTTGDNTENATKLCVPDSCAADLENIGWTNLYTKGDAEQNDFNRTCSCQGTSISCPMDLPESLSGANNTRMFRLKDSCTKFPMCISDPCEDYGGTYKTGEGSVGGEACSCPDGKVPTATKTNWTGSFCSDPCLNNGPCGQGSYKRGDCRVVNGNTECVRPEVASSKCAGRTETSCGAQDFCEWDNNDMKCEASRPGKGGCLCPYKNPCNGATSRRDCERDVVKSEVGIIQKCEWEDSGTSSLFNTGQRCVLTQEALKIKDKSGSSSIFQNTCSEKQGGVGLAGSGCLKSGWGKSTGCCNKNRDGYQECIDHLRDNLFCEFSGACDWIDWPGNIGICPN